MTVRNGKLTKFAGLSAAAILALSACGGDNGDDAEENGNGDDVSLDIPEIGEGETITLGYVDGWTDGSSTTFLWQHILEEAGYEVEVQALGDAAPLFQGVADGDIEVYPSAWLPGTHSEYMDNHGDELEDLGSYYEGAVLTLAVPEYTDIDSIEELADNAEDFDNQIVGIEAGAGHMATTQDDVMPGYGLDGDFELVESSTAAMLSELDNAIEAEEDIVVTLWRPFWAYGTWDLKDLEDPEGLYGDEETLNPVANAGFAEEFPEVAEWMSGLELSDDEYAELEDLVVNEHDEGPEGAVEWAENNAELINELTAE